MLKIKTFRKDITPVIGTLLAGYAANVVSDGINDPLFISGLSLYDGKNKVVLMSFDLLGMDEDIVKEIRKACASVCGIPPRNIILTCTHTHSGPHTRRNYLADIDTTYISSVLMHQCEEAAKGIFTEMTEVSPMHYSAACHENINRRIILPENKCQMLPQSKNLWPMAEGITDPELGILYFTDINDKPICTIVNYAAHPLCCQTGGSSSLKISSDYPGYLRDFVERELGGLCIFTSGACGDLHPKGMGKGFREAERMGISIGEKITYHFYDVLRNKEKFTINSPSIKIASDKVEVLLRKTGGIEKRPSIYEGKEKVKLEIQFLTLGNEICLAGMPGEILAEPGLEMKWHSPFKKTFILYNSTGYISYIPHGNAYISGGYEADTAHLESDASFRIVSATIERMRKLRSSL